MWAYGVCLLNITRQKLNRRWNKAVLLSVKMCACMCVCVCCVCFLADPKCSEDKNLIRDWREDGLRRKVGKRSILGWGERDSYGRRKIGKLFLTSDNYFWFPELALEILFFSATFSHEKRWKTIYIFGKKKVYLWAGNELSWQLLNVSEKETGQRERGSQDN